MAHPVQEHPPRGGVRFAARPRPAGRVRFGARCRARRVSLKTGTVFPHPDTRDPPCWSNLRLAARVRQLALQGL